MKEYRFKPKKRAVITSHLARRLLKDLRSRAERTEITLDIGRTYVEAELTGRSVRKGDLELPKDVLEEMAEEGNSIFVVENGRFRKLSLHSSGHFYKLVSVGEAEPPTLEIDGIHMHRVTDATPWEDSSAKIRALRIKPGNLVLDTCTGLGYTAIISLKFGAKMVLSCEVDPNVLSLAEYNPWSVGLSSEKVLILNEDATYVARSLKSNLFDSVVHDPPRFGERSGPLYSSEFYEELFRVMRKGARMYHYTGAPGEKYRRKTFVGGVKGRLKAVGFSVWRVDEIKGLLARKPKEITN